MAKKKKKAKIFRRLVIEKRNGVINLVREGKDGLPKSVAPISTDAADILHNLGIHIREVLL